MSELRVVRDKFMPILLGALILLGLYLSSLYSYLLFHSLAELFSIVIAWTVFILAWNARDFIKNGYLQLVGIAAVFVGGIDLVHMLAYKGMGVFPAYGSNLPTQLWIAARYLQSASFLAAPLLFGRRLRPGYVLIGYMLAVVVLLGSIFSGLFPDCYIEGVGLTPFKRVSEYGISLILLAAIGLLLRQRPKFDPGVLGWLIGSLVLSILAELSFTFYVGVYDFFNLLGHYFKILAFYLLYKALVETGFQKPYRLLLRELKQGEERLQRYAGELEQRNEEIKQFAYTISHDLRSPLINLRGFAAELGRAAQELDQILGITYPHLDPSQQQVVQTALREDIPEAIALIDSSVIRMDRFIQAVLNLSRLGRRELQLELVDMEVLVQGVLQSLAHQIEARQTKITVGPMPKVTADWVSMEQVIGNLLSNAVLYLEPGRQGIIEVGAKSECEETIFWVQDNGRGIAEKDWDKVFAPFQRAGKQDVPGEGMGLAYVRTIVRRHHGRIWFESEPGVGTTFYFALPTTIEKGKHRLTLAGNNRVFSVEGTGDRSSSTLLELPSEDRA